MKIMEKIILILSLTISFTLFAQEKKDICIGAQSKDIKCINCKKTYKYDEEISFLIENVNKDKRICFFMGIAVKKNDEWKIITSTLSEQWSIFSLSAGSKYLYDWKNKKTDSPPPQELKRKGEKSPEEQGLNFISYDLKDGGKLLLFLAGKDDKMIPIHEFDLLPAKSTQ